MFANRSDARDIGYRSVEQDRASMTEPVVASRRKTAATYGSTPSWASERLTGWSRPSAVTGLDGCETRPLGDWSSMKHLRRWGAVYVLLALFLGSWIGQLFTQLAEFTSEQQQHGQAFAWPDFLASFFAATLENWQSEWLQLVFQAILLMGAKHIIFQTEAEDIERIERKLDAVAETIGAPRAPRDQDEPGDPGAIKDT